MPVFIEVKLETGAMITINACHIKKYYPNAMDSAHKTTVWFIDGTTELLDEPVWEINNKIFLACKRISG